MERETQPTKQPTHILFNLHSDWYDNLKTCWNEILLTFEHEHIFKDFTHDFLIDLYL